MKKILRRITLTVLILVIVSSIMLPAFAFASEEERCLCATSWHRWDHNATHHQWICTRCHETHWGTHGPHVWVYMSPDRQVCSTCSRTRPNP